MGREHESKLEREREREREKERGFVLVCDVHCIKDNF